MSLSRFFLLPGSGSTFLEVDPDLDPDDPDPIRNTDYNCSKTNETNAKTLELGHWANRSKKPSIHHCLVVSLQTPMPLV